MALKQIGGENITVSNAVIGPTAAQITTELHMASFVHLSGGDINMNIFTDPEAAAVNGDFPSEVGDKWEIWGPDDIQSFRMIRQASDAVVAVQYFGTGKS